MRIAALTRVRFDGDIIEESVRHNLRFVDRVYVLNNASPDGTQNVLRRLQEEGLRVTVWADAQLDDYTSLNTKLVRQVFEEDPAEHLLFFDADEFLKAPSRAHLEASLAALPPGTHGTVPWTTYVPTPEDPEDPRLLARVRHRLSSESPQFSKVIISRSFAARIHAEISAGMHGIHDPENSAEMNPLKGMHLAHFPVRSIAQLQGKALLGWSSFLLLDHERGDGGYQWRRLYDELRNDSEWSSHDLHRFALTYLGEREPAPEFIFDPLPPVERRYLHSVPPLNTVAIEYIEQLTSFCVSIKRERGQLRDELTAAQSGKTVFLHVGTHKTGTSSLQAVLGLQHEKLASSGIHVPQPAAGNRDAVLALHHDAASALLEDREPNLSFQSLLDDLRKSNLPVAVLSSENFEHLFDTPKMLERLARGLRGAGYRPRVLLYVRDQGSYAESLYTHLVKGGLFQHRHGLPPFALSFDSYLETILKTGAITFGRWTYCFEYSKIAGGFAESFGGSAVAVRPYRPDESDDFIVRDFLSSISGSTETTPGLATPPQRLNRSSKFIDVLRALYEQAPYKIAEAADPDALVEQILGPEDRGFLSEAFSILDRNDEERVLERFSAENRKLMEAYGVDLRREPLRPSVRGLSPQKRLMRAAAKSWNLD